MRDGALPACIEPDHPGLATLCADLPPDRPVLAALAVTRRLGPLHRRRGVGRRPITDVLGDRSANCMDYTLVLVSALRRLGVPAAGLIGLVKGTAPVCVHAVGLVAERGTWHVLDVDRPEPAPLDDVVARGELRPMVAWHEHDAVLLYGATAGLSRLYDERE